MISRQLYTIFAITLITLANIADATDLEQVKAALENISSNSASNISCLTNGESKNKEREYINALLFKEKKEVKAIIFNRNFSPQTTLLPPCENSLGLCAIYSGNLDSILFDKICNRNNKNLYPYTKKGTVFSILKKKSNSHEKNLPGTECLNQLAKKLTPEDKYAECNNNVLFYSTPNPDSSRKIRIEKNNKKLFIDHIRINIDSIPTDWLLGYTEKHGITKIETVGETGFITDGLLIQKLDGLTNCKELVDSIDIFRNNVKQANKIFPISNLKNENKADFWNHAYNDVIQQILGGNVTNGRTLSFYLYQTPDLFITKLNQGSNKCTPYL